MRLSLLLLLCFPSLCYSFKILVYSTKIALSHTRFMGAIADILVEEGHDVTTLIPVIFPNLTDGTTRSRIIHVQPTKRTLELLDATDESNADFFEVPANDFWTNVARRNNAGALFSGVCKSILNEPGLLESLKNESFDVLITENFDVCGIGLSHYIAPKSTVFGSTTYLFGDQYYEAGVPRILSFDPSPVTSKMNVHSMWDRAVNIVNDIGIRATYKAIRTSVDAVLKEHFGPDFPGVYELSSRSAFVFTNNEPLIGVATPTLHRVLDLGGLTLQEPRPIDEEWNKILSRRRHNVIFSFGSVTPSSSIKLPTKRNILEAFRLLPEVTVIWKYEKVDDDFAVNEVSRVPNVVLSPWIPQNDLLNDSRISLFVTHCGMASTLELAHRGVPGLFIPLFGDQPRNALMLERNGLGRVFDKAGLKKPKKLAEAIMGIIDDKKYSDQAKDTARRLAGKPFSPRELLVKYVAFAAEFGPSSALRPVSHDMSIIEYHNIDIVVIFLVLVCSMAILSMFTVRAICRFVMRRCGKEKKE